MLYFNKLNSPLSFYGAIHRAFVYFTISSVLLFNLLNFHLGKEFSNSNQDNNVFISISLQNSIESNINEKNLRYKNSENINYSIYSILNSITSQIRLSDSYDVDNLSKIFGYILISSPNNHSFRGPPYKG